MGVICSACSAERASELNHYKAHPTTPPKSEAEKDRRPESKIPKLLTSTSDRIDGYTTVINLGVVRGSSVRSRHVGSEAVAGLKSIVGGELKGVTKLIADAREQAMARLFRDADSLGANAIIGMRFATSQVWESAAEVMAYGTAVVVKPQEKFNEAGD
jgi:uncharacterized protein YbjQ (UPF0145 family)